MASLQATTIPNERTRQSFDEFRWVIQVRQALDEELEDEISGHPVSIFNVPKALLSSNPELYIPQQVAIGPYHHWRPELYEMERYKLSAAKRIQKYHFRDVKLQKLVEKFMKVEHKIRNCYHKYLDLSGETLAWIMAIDASFLLEFLQVYAMKEGKALWTVSPRMSHLVDHTGRKSTHNAILRDLVMLENQVPLFVLRKMLEFQLHSLESGDEMMMSMLMGLSEELSPFKMVEELPNFQVSDCAHLLDFLYRVFVPQPDRSIDITENEHDQIERDESVTGRISCYRWPILLLKKLIFSRHLKVLLKLPWTVMTNLPGISVLKQSIEYLFFSETQENAKQDSNNTNKPPLIEEIAIPSITELTEIGIRFQGTNGNISSINFDPNSATFCLPAISLDINSEVILSNMVAYEAANASGPLIFTRYTELMNGIIDTVEDVKALRRCGVIVNRLKSDGDVARLWNGMSKSIRLTKVPFLDKVVEDVNIYYNTRWKVKIRKLLTIYVFRSWQSLTLLAAVMLLFLMTLQAFCTIYSCVQIFHIE